MPNFEVRIEVRDVTRGDIEELVEDLMEQHGVNYDAPKGDFVIRVFSIDSTEIDLEETD